MKHKEHMCQSDHASPYDFTEKQRNSWEKSAIKRWLENLT